MAEVPAAILPDALQAALSAAEAAAEVPAAGVKFVFIASVAFKFVFLARRVSKCVFMACVAYQVSFLGVCRLPSLFSWGVCRLPSFFASPSRLVFLACVAFQVCFLGVCRLLKLACFLSFLGVCRLPSSFCLACVPSPSKFVFFAAVAAFQVRFLSGDALCCLPSLFPWRVSPCSLS